jgi:F-type H+-transporting ATPase subunit b
VIPDLSLVWVIVLVLTLSVILDRLLLRPVTRVVQERDGAIRAARDLAEASRAKAQAASDELEAKTRAVRAEVYGQMDEQRRAALGRRAEMLLDTRREVEQSIADATNRVHTQTAAARSQLEHDADALATTIVERVLGRKAS